MNNYIRLKYKLMSFFNLFFKNLIGCKIKESDIICNNSIKKNNPDYLNVSLSLSDSKEKYAVNKVIDKLKLDDRQRTFNNYDSFNDQLQKISDELDRLKLSDTVDGGGGKRKLKIVEKKIDKSDDNTLPKKRFKLEFKENKLDKSDVKADQNVSGILDFNKTETYKSDVKADQNDSGILDFNKTETYKSDVKADQNDSGILDFNKTETYKSDDKADQNDSGILDSNKMEIDESDNNTSFNDFERTYKLYDNNENLNYIKQFYKIPKQIL